MESVRPARDRSRAHGDASMERSACASLTCSPSVPREGAIHAGTTGRARRGAPDGCAHAPLLVVRVRVAPRSPEFEVRYASLEEELKVGEVYLRLLLDGAAKTLEIHAPGRFFNELYHRLLWEPRREIRLLCLHGMAVTYRTYHASIGPFPDTAHVVHLLATTLHKAERDRLLQLVQALLVSAANAKRFIANGGLQHLLSLLTTVHLESERSAHSQVLQSNLLTSNAEAAEPAKEWYVRKARSDRDLEDDDGAGQAASGSGAGEGGASLRGGPYGLQELRSWLVKHAGSPPFEDFECWASGMGEPEARSSWQRPLDIAHLRWTILAEGVPLLSYTNLGAQLLELFLHLTTMHPTRTPEGALIHPMPTPKKVLSHADRLPHLVQLLLTMEPSIVERAATLLTRLVEDNPTLPRLYLTGAFYFALMYTGSNVLPIVRFLRVAHVNQLHRDEENAAEGLSGGLSGRSYLTLILPQAMVCCLEAHGPDKFAEVFLGDFDTPEYIWNHEMRRYMIERLALHVGNLPVQLQDHCGARYDYCPLPRVQYPELKSELFCHRYYLRNLNDEARFASWPIDEPVPLLQAVLSAWQAELKKVPSSMSREEALKVLGLSAAEHAAPGPEAAEGTLRRAYHKLAARYHPDKNPDPEAREMFEKVQKAYELASAEANAHGGPSAHNITLMLKAQCILYTRCAAELAPFKYSGYPLLLKVLATVDADGLDSATLFTEANGELLLPAAKLLHATIAAATLNANELQHVGGVEALVALFRRCVSMLTTTSEPSALPYQVLMPLMWTLAAIGSCAACTAALASEENAPVLDDVVRCLRLSQLPQLPEAALDAVASLSLNPDCQAKLADAGVAWYAFAMLCDFDFTLDQAVAGGVEAAAESNAQLVANERARKAAHALRRLAGCRGAGTAPQQHVMRAAIRVLTQHLAELLDSDAEGATSTLLRLLNSASETPYLIWNGSLRAEMLEYVTARLERSYTSPASAPLDEADALIYEALREELKVGSVYVRVYTEQPTYPLHDAPQFCAALLMYLSAASSTQASAAEETVACPVLPSTSHVSLALQAMLSLLSSCHNFNLEEQLLVPGRLNAIFSYASEDQSAEVLEIAIKVGCACCNSAKCVTALGEDPSSFVRLFPLLRATPDHLESLLALLTSLAANSKVVGAFLRHGALLHVLYLFVSSQVTIPTSAAASAAADTGDEKASRVVFSDAMRAMAGTLLRRIATDRTHAARVNGLVERLMPTVFLQTMSEDALRTVCWRGRYHPCLPTAVPSSSCPTDLRSPACCGRSPFSMRHTRTPSSFGTGRCALSCALPSSISR